MSEKMCYKACIGCKHKGFIRRSTDVQELCHTCEFVTMHKCDLQSIPTGWENFNIILWSEEPSLLIIRTMITCQWQHSLSSVNILVTATQNKISVVTWPKKENPDLLYKMLLQKKTTMYMLILICYKNLSMHTINYIFELVKTAAYLPYIGNLANKLL